ncbi:hypothetical protein BCL76_11383 [Streptomyces sp. CG 926]|uniref:hypothetical protein n=1 Tax=Streptomyces sp. CG 926 TaxID=1882405 RepID=UPI000D6C73C8|nr:hypothetical protein [Streptomyces sp. CG 926]PWK65096.1 hypothetical protein BCL76_11383 [Streptomyces sp. CG 926]
MTSTPSPLPRPSTGLRLRALLSWMCCVAALLLAVTVCHRSGPPPAAGAGWGMPSTASTVQNADTSGSVEGCVDHRPGDTCLTALHHLPGSILPLPEDVALPGESAAAARPPARAGPAVGAPLTARGVDLHSLQVLRI